ncbi:MAG: hypothetical protein Q9225_006707 [Loekoesia sp. 1 TL-2023]
MRILCLHGVGTNANVDANPDPNPNPSSIATYELTDSSEAPVLYELSKTHELHFRFVNGPTEAPAAAGTAEQYEGPFYRWYDQDAPEHSRATALARALSKHVSHPEEFAREMRRRGMTDISSSSACDFIETLVDQQDEAFFDGILGFSEGASAAASLLLRQSVSQSPKRFRFAVFICGAPPCHDQTRGIVLADESQERIIIPTAHIVGSQDPNYRAGLALYNLCDQRSASIYDHGKTHTIPWDSRVTQAIANEIRAVIRRSLDVMDDHQASIN